MVQILLFRVEQLKYPNWDEKNELIINQSLFLFR